MTAHSESLNFTLPDGAMLAYEIFSLEHLTKSKLPIILIGGLTSLKTDWERLIAPLSKSRTVLTFDHRGIGDSTYSTPEKNDEITIELMARDLLALIEHVGWKDVDIIGFSMGGVILQQLLLLPNSSQATPLPFCVHHALLAATFCSPLQHVLQPPTTAFVPPPPGQPLTVEQKKELARPMLDASLGPKWVALPENQERYERWLERAISGRPLRTILKQRKALGPGQFDFRQELGTISPSIKVLVIHGREDLIVPFSCGGEILQAIPHARAAEIGSDRGQVPSYEFGHMWYEYFGMDVWIGVIETFVDDGKALPENSHL